MPQLDISLEEFEELIDYSRDNPAWYVRNVLASNPWSRQIDIINSTFKYKYTAVKTGNAVGKSYIAARIALAFLNLKCPSIVVTTAPTWRQVTDILWREIGTAYKQARYKLSPKEVTQAGLNLDTDWYAVGLSTSRPENFFGYHSNDILVIVDEAGGVDDQIFKGVDAITPNVNARVLLIGNPTSPSGKFYDAFTKPELGYNCFTISAFDSPNFIDTGMRTIEDVLKAFTPPEGVEQAQWTAKVNRELEPMMNPDYRGLIDPSVVYSRYHEWGTDSPAWQALIMGEFPTQAEQSLIPMDIARMAFGMNGIDKDTGKTFAELSGWQIPDGPERYGQDMARFGSDKNVLTPRHGGWVRKQVAWGKNQKVKGSKGIDLMTSADIIVDIIDVDDPLARVNIDDTGNGGGTTDRIHQKSAERASAGEPSYQFRLATYNMSSKERMAEPNRFHDVTSEVYWNLRTWFIKKKIAFEEFDQELYDELVGRRWGINKSTGKIQVESKEDYKKRTGGTKSPDKSDSLALAFAGEKPDGTYHDVQTNQDEYYDDKIREIVQRNAEAPITAGLQDRY